MDRLVHSCEVGLDRAEGGNSNWHHREWHTLLVQIVEGNNIVMGNGGMQQVLVSMDRQLRELTAMLP